MRRIWIGQAADQAPVAAKVLTDQTFNEAMAAPKAVAMFYSPNCPYSRKFMPIFQSLAGQSKDVLFATVNVDENVANAGTYKVHMLPTVVFLVSGKEAGRVDGVQEQSDFTAEMAKAFSGGSAPAAAEAKTIQATADREGTPVVTAPQGPSPAAYILGGTVIAGILGAVGYAIWGK
jgi:thioredoxin-like negative regulator of GroEL